VRPLDAGDGAGVDALALIGIRQALPVDPRVTPGLATANSTGNCQLSTAN
jgi:hypothetical protein